ncbi:hypothetical protein HPB48_004130 [Haemaphysalis longicornis]|uniref:Uncharacterized protein n=1 Tax=Haemaphysalis longicornis TaxID=44386 RepID=A0A9J6FMW4_HAELO|nr:hypothetical protein HPB48_004130 [Haemaphysalis longicornis]
MRGGVVEIPKEVRGWAALAMWPPRTQTGREGGVVVCGRGSWKRAAATKRAEAPPQDSPPGLNDLRAEIRTPCTAAALLGSTARTLVVVDETASSPPVAQAHRRGAQAKDANGRATHTSERPCHGACFFFFFFPDC